METVKYEDCRRFRVERLKFVRNMLTQKLSDEAMLTTLRRNRVVSSNYRVRNLAVDKWFVSKSSARHRQHEIICGTDKYSALWFRVIVKALQDLYADRPCDLGIWSVDMSPDLKCCSAEYHVCSPGAYAFLCELPQSHLQLINVGRPCLNALLDEAIGNQTYAGIKKARHYLPS